MKKILFVTQKRKDAIWIVDESVKKELKKIEHPFDFLEIHEKWKWALNILKNYIRNFFLLRKTCFKYDTLYFTWENPYVIFVRVVYWKKKIIMTVHHVEDYWWKSIVWKLMIKSTNKFIAISNLLLTGASSKWLIFSPVLVPLFMQSNISPQFAQIIMRAGDSMTNGITPLFAASVIYISYLNIYNLNKEKPYTLKRAFNLVTPYFLLISVTWIVLIVGWYIVGLPIGPNVLPTI